jgi:hypothetical protein
MPVRPRSVRLNNLDNWLYEASNPTEEGQKLQIVAKRDYVCFVEGFGWNAVTPPMLRGLNPAIKVYRLYDLMCKNTWDSDWTDPTDTTEMQTPITRAVIELDTNDWWLRDGDGEIVKENDTTWFLDVGKEGFKQEFLTNTLARMAGKGFDGILFDYWHPGLTDILGANPRPVAYPTDDEWYAVWQDFVDYVMAGVHGPGYRIIGNCTGEYGTGLPWYEWQRTQVDGTTYGQWAVGWEGEWLTGAIVEGRIGAFLSDPLETWADDFGLRPTLADYNQKRLVGLAMYYIALPRFRWDRSYHYPADGKVFWDPLWDFYIGWPVNPAVKREGKYFWSRRYTKGYVLLNYEADPSAPFDLAGEYRYPSGALASSPLTLAAHTGVILGKV